MFPRVNSALSSYLKNSRYRAGASVALTIAAAAGVGAASATAGAGPWASSLNSLAIAGHGASDGAAGQAGTNVFHAVVPPKPGEHQPTGSQDDRQAPGPGQPKDAHVQLADQQKSAPQHPRQAQQGVLAALPPLPVHHAADQARHAASTWHLATPHHASAPARQYTIYDSVSPNAIPSSQQHVAVYGNGKYQASWSDVHGRHRVLWIDTNASNPGCDVLDVEPGDATPSGAARWVRHRLTQYPDRLAVVYTMRAEWPQVKKAIGTLPDSMRSRVRYWIADPTGIRHLVPGSSATQWYWGAHFDKTTALPEFDQ